MNEQHKYHLTIQWTGHNGVGTTHYESYSRSHKLIIHQKTDIDCSSDPAFRGDPSKHNPEELFVASIASCHMLWYLHLCAEAGVHVIDYTDNAEGTMQITKNGGGHFIEVVLKPIVIVSKESMIEKARELHHKANELCFIANSCNFPILHEPTFIVKR
jgi:organic hydroperoxide reductase OsmC/OhrA